MDRDSVDWQGQGTAIVTPFHEDGTVDEAALRRQVGFLIAHGVNLIVANGCTGEFWAQTPEERRRVVEVVVEAAAGRVPVIGGASMNHTQGVVELSRDLRGIGCSGVLILPPFFVHPSPEEIFQHFKAVSDAVEIPIMLYNIPQETVNDLTPDLVDRLADLPNVVAIKDSTYDFNVFSHLQSRCGDRIRIMIGPSMLLGMPAVLSGAAGWVDTHSNLWPDLTVELYQAVTGGDIQRARELQKTGSDFRRFLSSCGHNMYSTVKAAMNLVGLPGGYPRAPLRPLKEPQLSQLRAGLERFGVPHHVL